MCVYLGTGKTTVARFYGELLHELGALPSAAFEETTGAKLSAGGVVALTKLLSAVVDDGTAPLVKGEKVKTDFEGKGKWTQKGRITLVNSDGTYHIAIETGKARGKARQLASVPRDRVRSCEKGGVLFVDEAYQLEPQSNPTGRQVLDCMLVEMEDRRGELCVVFAGYKKPIEVLLEHNEGLPSRFRMTFNFPDFSDTELCSVLTSIIADKSDGKYALSDIKFARISAQRLGRLRGTKGFGNARAVRNMVETVFERQSSRILSSRRNGFAPSLYEVTREDMLGPIEIDRESNDSLCKLRSMLGLTEVKESVDQLLQMMATNAEREENELPLQEVSLNRIFMGNPGTGKTSVATLYAHILKDLGLLTKGEVIIKNPSDFIGSALGESEKNTNSILDAALGSVLVIDEGIIAAAYCDLSPSSFLVVPALSVDTAAPLLRRQLMDSTHHWMAGTKVPIHTKWRWWTLSWQRSKASPAMIDAFCCSAISKKWKI